MTFEELDEFKRDVKSLLKRYRTLHDDLGTVKKVLAIHPGARNPFSYQIEGLGITVCVIKVKKIACRAIKGKGVNSGLRLVYAYYNDPPKIIFVELYHKSDQALEDRERIMKHFGNASQ